MVKKKEIKIIRKEFNKEEYTFASSDNILNNVNNLKDNESTTTNEKKSKINLMRELGKWFIQINHIIKDERF